MSRWTSNSRVLQNGVYYMISVIKKHTCICTQIDTDVFTICIYIHRYTRVPTQLNDYLKCILVLCYLMLFCITKSTDIGKYFYFSFIFETGSH